jgi:hypothetical protein
MVSARWFPIIARSDLHILCQPAGPAPLLWHAGHDEWASSGRADMCIRGCHQCRRSANHCDSLAGCCRGGVQAGSRSCRGGVCSSIQRGALPCPALPCPALPCPALPCPALPCPALPCPALPCLALPKICMYCVYTKSLNAAWDVLTKHSSQLVSAFALHCAAGDSC